MHTVTLLSSAPTAIYFTVLLALFVVGDMIGTRRA